MADLKRYLKCRVAKVFPLYGDEPFKGVVDKVETTDDDDMPIHISYDDGDDEWVTVAELQEILIGGDVPAAAAAAGSGAAVEEAPKKKRGRSAKSSQPAAGTPSTANKDTAKAAAALGAGKPSSQQQAPAAKKHKPSSTQQATVRGAAPSDAAAGVAGENFNAEHAKRELLKQKHEAGQGAVGAQFTYTAGSARAAADKAKAELAKDKGSGGAAAAVGSGGDAAAGSGGGQKVGGSKGAVAGAAAAAPSKSGGGVSGAAATAAGTGGGVSSSRRAAAEAAAGAPSASPAVTDLDGLLTNINRAAGPTARKMIEGRSVARIPYKASGAAALPAMSQAVVVDGHCHVTIYSTPKQRSSSSTPAARTPAAAAAATPAAAAGDCDYTPEAESLLAELDKLLQQCGSSKHMLVKVAVTLRSMEHGLPGFQAAWNAWVDRASLPVLTLCEGVGPFKSSGLVLEATALAYQA